MRMMLMLALLVFSLAAISGCATQPSYEPSTLGEWGKQQRPKI